MKGLFPADPRRKLVFGSRQQRHHDYRDGGDDDDAGDAAFRCVGRISVGPGRFDLFTPGWVQMVVKPPEQRRTGCRFNQAVQAEADHLAGELGNHWGVALYGNDVRPRIASLPIEEVLTAPQSPWRNPYVERLIRSIRRDSLNHFVILNARHLKRPLASYFAYYCGSRTPWALDKQCLIPQRVSSIGRIIEIPQLGGLHHRYERIAA